MKLLVVATLAAIVAGVTPAHANGRRAAISTIHFRPGHPLDIWAGATFGGLWSHDGGATWNWTCEDAIGYGGVLDPDVVYTDDGSIYASTYTGLMHTQDACTFTRVPAFGIELVTQVERAEQTGEIWVALTDNADDKIYYSTDNGASFPPTNSAEPGLLGDWWQTLAVAPSDAKRLYATSYRFVADGSGGTVRVNLMFRSDDAGKTYVPIPSVSTFTQSPDSVIEIAAISPTDPDVVFARVTFETDVIGDAIYRSVDKGATWTRVLGKGDAIGAFAIRPNGDVVAGTLTLGAWVSHDCGSTGACTWTDLVNPPHTSCFVNAPDGSLWACSSQFGTTTIPTDGYLLMKSTDLATWSPVLKIQDIAGPIDCPNGTPTNTLCTKCEPLANDAGGQQTPKSCWCSVRMQYGITANPSGCVTADATSIDAPTITIVKHPKGCCDTGGDGVAPGAVMLTMIGAAILLRRPRRR